MADTSLVFRLFGRDVSLGKALKDAGKDADGLNTKLRNVGVGVSSGFVSAASGISLLGVVGAGVFGGLAAGMAGVGAAIAGIGIAAAAQNEQVKKSFSSLAEDAKKTITQAAAPLVPVLQNVATQARGLLAPLGQSLGAAFKALAPALNSLVNNVAVGLRPLINAFGPIARAVSPLIEAIGNGLRPVMAALAQTLTTVAQTAGQFAPQLEQMFVAISQVVTVLGPLLSALIRLGAPIIGPLLSLVAQLAGALTTALAPVFTQLGPIIGQVVTALSPLVTALGQVIAAVAPLLVPIAQLISQLVSGLVPVLTPIINLLAQLASQIVSLLVPAINAIVPVLVPVIQWIGRLAEIILSALSAAISWLIANVPKAWEWIKTAIGNAVNAISGIISWFGSLPGKIGAWIAGAKDAAVSRFSAMVAFVRTIPGKIIAGLASLGSRMLGIGRDMIQGLINGARQMAANLVNTVKGFVNDAINAAKNLLGIASPSKVFTWIGNQTTKGLIKGLLSDVSGVKSASKTLASTVMSAWKKGQISTNFASSLLTVIDRNNTRLQSLAKQRESILKRIEDAKKMASEVSGDARGFAALSNIRAEEDKPITAARIRNDLANKLSRIRRFSTVIKALAKRGLAKSLLVQVIQAGPDQGLELGEALLNSEASTLAAINSSQAAILKASTDLGMFSADVMYDSGKQAGKGFLTGLAAQEKAIISAMDKLAKTLVTRIRKALKIKSPSQLFHEIGAFSGQGLIRGLEASMDGVSSASERLAMATVPSVPTVSPYGASAVGNRAGSGEVRVVIDVRGSDSEFLRMIRKMVRVEGGGSVQVAFGRG